MTKIIKPSEKTIAFVKGIFEQGDVRYDDDYSAYLVASFIENKGLEITKKIIKDRFKPSDKELDEIGPPQQFYKFVGKKMLERYGYKLICFEGSLPAGRPDILAKHTHYNERLAVMSLLPY